jgi:hypothetical protein
MESKAARHPLERSIPCHRSGVDVNAPARSTVTVSLQKLAAIDSQLKGIRVGGASLKSLLETSWVDFKPPS